MDAVARIREFCINTGHSLFHRDNSARSESVARLPTQPRSRSRPLGLVVVVVLVDVCLFVCLFVCFCVAVVVVAVVVAVIVVAVPP